MSYSYQATSIVALAKLLAFGGSSEPAYPSSNTDWYTLVNTMWRNRVYPRLLLRGDDWAYKVTTTALTASQATYSVSGTSFIAAGNMHRLKRLNINWSSTVEESVPHLDERQRTRMAVVTWGRDEAKGYVLRGNVLELVPTPTSADVVTVVYVPTATTLTNATATITGPECMDECIALETAVRVRVMQGEDTRDLRADLEQAYSNFDEAARSLRQDDAPRIVDVMPEYSEDDLAYFREPRA